MRGAGPAPAGTATSGSAAPTPTAPSATSATGPATATTTGTATAPAATDLTADLGAICDAVSLAGATDRAGNARVVLVAQYLGTAITSEAGRAFLVRFGQTPPQGKAQLLRDAATAAGLPGCALADEWDAQPPP